jgi:hypothetical protein
MSGGSKQAKLLSQLVTFPRSVEHEESMDTQALRVRARRADCAGCISIALTSSDSRNGCRGVGWVPTGESMVVWLTLGATLPLWGRYSGWQGACGLVRVRK